MKECHNSASCLCAGSEAAAWERVAREAWAHAGPISHPPASQQPGEDVPGSIEDVLGGKEHLKGKGSAGRGMLMALQLRRALPMM